MGTHHQLTGQRVAITGGAGFIGSTLATHLAPANDVLVIDTLSTGYRENIPDSATFLEQDIRKLEPADLKDVDVLFHEAANISVPRSVEDPIFDAEHNVKGLIQTLEAAVEAGVDRVVFASSSAVYGTPDSVPVSETAQIAPQSPYAASKYAGEQYCCMYGDLYDIETVRLRYFNVYGPRQRADSGYAGVVSIFTDQLLSGDPLTIQGGGSQTRDFVYVDDVVQANIAAATADAAPGNVYNIGTGTAISIAGLADELEAIVDEDVDRVYNDGRTGDVQRSRADISRAASELAFEPETELREGLAATVEWRRTNAD